MEIPESLKYSKDHGWVRMEGAVARIGITDLAQDALGGIVHVELPLVGLSLVEGQNIGEVESSKSVSEIYSPIGGTISAVNTLLEANPALLNSDPYGEGWICEITGFESSAIKSLLDAEAYRGFIGN